MAAYFHAEVAGSCQHRPHEQKWINAIFLDKECMLSWVLEGWLKTLKFIGGEAAVFGWRERQDSMATLAEFQRQRHPDNARAGDDDVPGFHTAIVIRRPAIERCCVPAPSG